MDMNQPRNLHERKTSGSQTLTKGLLLLEKVAELQSQRGVGLAELTRELGWNKSTIHRLLSSLKAREYVDQDEETERYRIGLRALHLGAAFMRDLELRRAAAPILQSLEARLDHTVSLVIFDVSTAEVVYVDFIDGSLPVRVHRHVGMRFPANCTAAGKAILAYLPESSLLPIFEGGLKALTPGSISTADELRNELVTVAKQGYATDDRENSEGVRCVAAPVFDYTGNVVAALSISGPAPQISVDQFPVLGSLVRSSAADLSRRMGFLPSRFDSNVGERDQIGANAAEGLGRTTSGGRGSGKGA